VGVDDRPAGRRALAGPDDVLTRLGITGEAAPTGRAARRRAAERDAGPGSTGRHASPGAQAATRPGRHGAPESAAQARNGTRHGVTSGATGQRPPDDPGSGRRPVRQAPDRNADRPGGLTRSGPPPGSTPAAPRRNPPAANGSARIASGPPVEGLHPLPTTAAGRHGSSADPRGGGHAIAGARTGSRAGGEASGVGGPGPLGSATTRTPLGSGRPPARGDSSRTARSASPAAGSGYRNSGPASASGPERIRPDRTPDGPDGRRRSGHRSAGATGLNRATVTDERPTTTLHRYDEDGEPSTDDVPDERARRIDETLTRLTAAHAGLSPREEDEEPAPPPEHRRRPVRILITAAVVALVLAVGAGWGAQRWLASGMGTVAALDPGSGAIVNAAAQQGAQNVLVIASARTGGAARPVAVTVAHVPPDGTSMTLLGIPVDLQVNRPPCARFDGEGYGDRTVPAEARSDLASALDVGGPRCATRVVQQLTGLAVTRYVALDLDAIGAAVDAVSGVTVCVPRPVVDRTLGPIAPTAGTVTLDGRRARDFVRAAAVDGEQAAGPGPVTRQQQVLAAVLGRVLSGTALLDLPRVAALRGALGPALATDGAGLDQVLALADPIGSGTGVTYRAVPTTPATQGGGTALAAGDASPLFAALRTGGPLPPPPDAAAPSVADVKVDILNGSTKTGQAAQVGSVLEGLGFTVDEVGSAPEQAGQTVIRFSPDQAAAAEVLAASVPSATTVADPGASGVLQLVLGRSFDSVVKAPTTGPAQPVTPPAAVACS
jgi:LCP family protein required for cell wall assembly